MPRTEFSAKVREQARERARTNGDLCECGCGGKLTKGKVQYHHAIEDVLDGEATLENCRAITTLCHDRITRERAPVLAKVKRQRRADAGIPTRRTPRRLPGGRHDTRKRLIGGGVVDRRTGEPLSPR